MKYLLLAFFIFIVACTPQPSGELDAFATCLSDAGLVMYGSVTCSHCQAQKAMFGDSFEFVGEVECHPRGPNPQTELCLEKGIELTPTWVLEKDGVEVDRLVGKQSLEKLSEVSGCSILG